MNLKTMIVRSGAAVACSALFGVTGCGPEIAPDKHVEVYSVPAQQIEGARFKVETAGKFRAGFENNVREILIISDTATGRKYIGVTGAGGTGPRSETEITTSIDADGNVSTDTT